MTSTVSDKRRDKANFKFPRGAICGTASSKTWETRRTFNYLQLLNRPTMQIPPCWDKWRINVKQLITEKLLEFSHCSLKRRSDGSTRCCSPVKTTQLLFSFNSNVCFYYRGWATSRNKGKHKETFNLSTAKDQALKSLREQKTFSWSLSTPLWSIPSSLKTDTLNKSFLEYCLRSVLTLNVWQDAVQRETFQTSDGG